MSCSNFKNTLRFSRNKNNFFNSDGILNQNPIIVTKTNAYNFTYTDSNKLQLAQLLARRDLKNIRETELKSQEAVKNIQVQEDESSEISKSKPKYIRNKKMNLQEKRLSSVKRVPGPQTPNRIITKKAIPIRSVSPPTKDTDKIWRPRQHNEIYPTEVNQMEKLQNKVDHCTNKLNDLEKLLQNKSSGKNDFSLNLMNPVKSNRELTILSDKLRQLMNTKISSQINFDNAISNSPLPEVPTRVVKKSPNVIDMVLSKLDNLASEMNNVQSRWQKLRYENISETFSDDENEIRFTKDESRKFGKIEFNIDQIDDEKLTLEISSKTVANLDKNRRQSTDQFQFQNVPVKPFHIDWLSQDLIDDIVDDVLNEINEVNDQLVDAILHSELAD